MGREAVHGEKLTVYHGRSKRPALEEVDLTLNKGQIYGLLGPSGCGKTTLLKTVVGRLSPTKGTVRVFGKTPAEPGFSIPGHGVGYMPQDLALYPEISTEETLQYFGRLFHMKYSKIKERAEILISLIDIPDKKTLIKNLSGGQQRRVSFAAALIHKPPLLILDEPTVGVDPILRQSIWQYLKDLVKTDNITVIITTHYVEEARQAHVVGLMREGRMLVQMAPDPLLKMYKAVTLEEVFLKLCKKDEQEHEPFEHTLLLSEKPQDLETVWTVNEEPESYDDKTSNSSKSLPISMATESLSDVAPTPSVTKLNHSRMRMNTLIWKSFLRLKRNIPLAFFEIFVPFLQVVVFCLCIGGEPFELPIAVVNLEDDATKFGQQFLNSLSNRTFQQIHYQNLSYAMDSTRNGETWGVIYINRDFTGNIIDRYLDGIDATNDTLIGSEIQLHLDTTNQQISITVYTSLLKAFQDFSRTMLNEVNYNPLLADAPIVMKDPIYGRKEPDFTEFMAPGMVLGITYIMAVGLTSMSIIMEKKDGLLDRSMVAGVTAGEVIFSITLHLFVMMVFQVAFVLIITFLVFKIPVVGSVFWVTVCVLLVGVSGMAYGLFISSICPDENSAMMVAMGSFYPFLLLSGIIWPVEAMPYVLRHLSYCLPMTLITRTMRSILSKGWDILDHGIYDGPLITLSWTIVLILMAWLIFKYKKHS